MEIPHTTMCETPLRAGVEVFRLNLSVTHGMDKYIVYKKALVWGHKVYVNHP
jgi:hypothetical protein